MTLNNVPHQPTDRQIHQTIVDQRAPDCYSSDFHFFAHLNQVWAILRVRFRKEHPVDRVCSPQCLVVLQGFPKQMVKFQSRSRARPNFILILNIKNLVFSPILVRLHRLLQNALASVHHYDLLLYRRWLHIRVSFP